MSNVFEEFPDVLGRYAEAGGTIFYADWHPTPRQVEGAFMWLAGYFENIEYPMVFSLMVAQEDTRERFRTETDPSGERWVELDPDYLSDKIAAGYPETILHREGTLSEDAPFGWKIVGESLLYDTSTLPPYGPIHQTGSGDPSNIGQAAQSRAYERYKRATKGFERAEYGDIKGTTYHEDTGEAIGRGKALPARPFIGISPEATEEIALIFSRWFDQGPEQMPWPEEPFTPTPAAAEPEIEVISRLPSGQPILRIPGVGVRFGRKGL